MRLAAVLLAAVPVAAFAQAPNPTPDQTWNIEVTEVLPGGKTKQVAIYTVRDCGYTHPAYKQHPPRDPIKALCNVVKAARDFEAQQKAKTPGK